MKTIVLPTHVGVILSCFFSHFFKCCTTHTRGGDPNSHYKLCFQNKYYPHTWGWSQSTQRRYLHYLVLPTHVGVILFDKFFNLIHVSTTHTRGGDPKNGLGFSSTGVYYPHTWGWSYLLLAWPVLIHVLPTHVGVILSRKGTSKWLKSTTHTRGGDPIRLN